MRLGKGIKRDKEGQNWKHNDGKWEINKSLQDHPST